MHTKIYHVHTKIYHFCHFGKKVVDFVCIQNLSLSQNNQKSRRKTTIVIYFVCSQNISQNQLTQNQPVIYFVCRQSLPVVDFVSIDFVVDFWSVRLCDRLADGWIWYRHCARGESTYSCRYGLQFLDSGWKWQVGSFKTRIEYFSSVFKRYLKKGEIVAEPEADDACGEHQQCRCQRGRAQPTN